MRRLSHAGVAHQGHHGIDLAPMLDFVVNLLIFFIITAVFVKQAGIEVSRPSGEATVDTLSKTIAIDAGGGISIDAKPIDLRAVRAHVEQFKAVDSKVGVVVAADRLAPTGVVVAVADEIRRGGVAEITFTTTTAAVQPVGKPQ